MRFIFRSGSEIDGFMEHTDGNFEAIMTRLPSASKTAEVFAMEASTLKLFKARKQRERERERKRELKHASERTK